jgi:probable HAF family extracellular repeat protein
LVELPLVPDGHNFTIATDPTGAYQIGYRTFWDANQTYHQDLIIWHGGAYELGPDLFATNTEFNAVNPSGIAAGFTGPDHRAAVYAYGRVITLPTPGGQHAVATGINANGQVVGQLENESGQPVRAVVWSPDGTAKPLASPAGYDYVEAVGIDDDGVVLGMAGNDLSMYSDFRIVVWLPGAGPRLLPGTRDDAGLYFWANDIRGGKILGSQNGPVAGDGRVLQWSVSGGEPSVVDFPGSRIAGTNAGGTLLLVADHPSDGVYSLFKSGIVRPIGGAFDPAQSRNVTDDGRVFGYGGGLPMLADCRG